MSRLKRLVREIHRRSIWQVLAIYVVGAWVGYEIIQGLTEGLRLPGWFPAFAVVLFIIGLPVVLATAFVQEGGPTARAVDPTLLPDIEESQEDRAGAAARASARPRGRAPATVRRLFTWRNAILGGVGAFALWGVVAAAWLLLAGGMAQGPTERAAGVDPDLVAVLPFRVTGSDRGLDYLREGMVDLIAAKLTGEGGPRALDPRTVLSVWRRAGGSDESDLVGDAALDLARSAGAGQVLLGGIVGTSEGLVINASLLGVADGGTRARASVEGPVDSLTAFIDRLTAQLLAREAGETEQRLAGLTSTSLPALRDYLEGQTDYRAGAYEQALEHYKTALELDSTFALAALGVISANLWTNVGIYDQHTLSLAWKYRGRLSRRDRLLLTAFAGPRYPAPSPFSEHLVAAERAVEAAPDRPEPWYWVGETYYHWGPAVGLESHRQRATDSFGRAVELDSAFAAPLGHLIDLAALRDDTTEVRRLAALYQTIDSAGDFASYFRWRAGVESGDSAALADLRSDLSAFPTPSLWAIVNNGQLAAVGLEDADSAGRLLATRSGTRAQRLESLRRAHDLALNRGRIGEALDLTQAIREVAPHPHHHLRLRVLDALFGGGDFEAGARAAAELDRNAAGRLAEDRSERRHQRLDICVVELWRVSHEDYSTLDRSLTRLRSAAAPQDPPQSIVDSRLCVAILTAARAFGRGATQVASAVEQLDSLLWTGPPAFGPLRRAGNLIIARLFEARGYPERALAATRRRVFATTDGSTYLATALREEGRLAALTGDREGAIEAYSHYLALRADPEPPLTEEAAAVRTELAKLVAESKS